MLPSRQADSPQAPGRDWGAHLWRLLLLLALGGGLLGLVLTSFCWWKAQNADQAYHARWQQAVDLEGGGASLYRLRLDHAHPSRYLFTALGPTTLDWPHGPLSVRDGYKVKAVAGLVLEAPQTLSFRVRGSDGVSVYIEGEPVFERWQAYPQTFDARFSQEVPAGRLLLEVDYLKAHPESGLSVEIEDQEGHALVLHPLKKGVDLPGWLRLRGRRDHWELRTLAALGLTVVLALLPLAWSLLRDDQWRGGLTAQARRLAPGFWLGFWPVMLLHMARVIANQDADDPWLLLAWPLLAGLAGALLQAFLFRPGGRGWPGLARAWAWCRAHEGLLLPGAVFVLWAGWLCYALASLGAFLPQAFLQAPWDAQQYKDIAQHWYWLSRTETGGIQGNYPWHMLLPIVGRLWHMAGVPIDWAMLLAVWPAALAVFYLAYHIGSRLFSPSAGRWTLAALACYPCSWFLLIGFPYALALALGMAFFLALRAGRLGLAVVLGYLLGLSYPTAVLAAVLPVMIYAPRLARDANPWPALGAMALACLAPLLGLTTFCLHHWYFFNDFWLPITGHEMWGRKPDWPWSAIADGMLAEPPQYPEAMAMLIIMGGMLIFAHRFHPALWALLLLTFVAGPSTGSLEAVYRQYLMAWPLFLLVGSSRRGPWLKMGWLWVQLYLALRWYLPLWLGHNLV